MGGVFIALGNPICLMSCLYSLFLPLPAISILDNAVRVPNHSNLVHAPPPCVHTDLLWLITVSIRLHHCFSDV